MSAPPPPPRPHDEPEHRQSAAPVLGFLLAIAGWFGGIVSVLSASDSDDPSTGYFLGVVLAVIGSGIAVVATLYDVANRR